MADAQGIHCSQGRELKHHSLLTLSAKTVSFFFFLISLANWHGNNDPFSYVENNFFCRNLKFKHDKVILLSLLSLPDYIDHLVISIP